MSVEGEPRGAAPAWYYVVTGGFKKGPFRIEQLRASVEAQTLTTADLVRADGATTSSTLGEVLARLAEREAVDREAAERATAERRAHRADGGRSRPRAPIDLSNAYAPPASEEDLAPVADALPLEQQGNFALGIALGFVGGCIALFFVGNMKPQTRKGVLAGFAASAVFGLIRVFALRR